MAPPRPLWTDPQVASLRKAARKHGGDWESVANDVNEDNPRAPQRTAAGCATKYGQLLKQKKRSKQPQPSPGLRSTTSSTKNIKVVRFAAASPPSSSSSGSSDNNQQSSDDEDKVMKRPPPKAPPHAAPQAKKTRPSPANAPSQPTSEKVRLRALSTIGKGMALAAKLGGVELDVKDKDKGSGKRQREERDSSEDI
ncbi:hypothetical protein BCR35DRAFT_224412 [Leucosporidium creatinivorum]|uniref:Myb-like domain-containing protein n=1 Tax=Leucosporidium creatinivorum TaxID=106004 RepID=A0A1Y2D8B7_9BASI|nr:hypothetical protein BCR35DRAFT_224412 [Leucosporidium creatinivorum]